MNSFYFIFSRFKKLKSKKGFLSFNFYLSIFLISFSLIAIILTDSFTQGYKNEIFSKLSSLNSDFKIKNRYDLDIDFSGFKSLSKDLSSIKEKIIYTPYIEKPAIIFSENKFLSDTMQSYKQREGVYALGIEKYFLSNNFLINQYLNNKNFVFSDSSIIIGDYLSKKINKTINDEIILLFFENSSNNFIAKKFIIHNIYKTQTQSDEFLTYVPIKALQDLNANLYCNGFLGDFLEDNNEKNLKLTSNLFVVEYWDSENILKFLNSFDIPVKLLMWILMFLSVYSLSSLIFNFLIQKKEDLKMLFLMGYSKKNLQYIAISITLYISMVSIFIGVSISSLVIYLQNKFKIINLPSEKIFQLIKSLLVLNFPPLFFA